jgi:predicted RNA-binding Zn-ribbon protein involved in translation (DUF1610 family)
MDILNRLHAAGLTIEPAGDQLVVRGPRHAMTPALADAIRQAKPALLALIPPGWPADVPIPTWWLELAGPMRDVLIEAAAHACPECGFAVAVRWRPSDGGAPRWACPRCGLHAGDGERPGADAELPPVVRACSICGFPPDGPRDDEGRCRWCAERSSRA